MKLLDKFRAQPEWQSDDPVVRVAAVRDLSQDDDAQDLLIEIARKDPDPSVRCEAVAGIADLDTLIVISRGDEDAVVRNEAREIVRDLVIETEDVDQARRGLEALSLDRDLVAIARTARLESISREALYRLSDPRSIGQVARRTTWSDVARQALTRLDDAVELQAIAEKTEDKAVALLAFERLVAGSPDGDVLERLAKRSKQKAVQRRAREALSALEMDTTQNDIGPAVPVVPAIDPTGLAEELEALAGESDLHRGRESLDRILQRWSELETPAADDLRARFHMARTTAEERLVALEAARLAQRRIEETRTAGLAQYAALCERVEHLGGDAPTESLRVIRADWARLSTATAEGDTAAGVGADAPGDLSRRFERAVTAFEERRARHGVLIERVKQMGLLLGEMEVLVQTQTRDSRSGQWATTDQRWRELVADVGTDAGGTLDEQLKTLMARHESVLQTRAKHAAQAKADRQKTETDNLHRLSQLVSTVTELVSSEKLQLGKAGRQLRALRRAVDSPGPLPRQDREAVLRKLRQAHTALLGRVRELRDFADWQRWANLGVQEDLCRRMENLREASVDDEAKLVVLFREIMTRWRDAADVPKDKGVELWRRFKAAHDAVYPRVERHREAQAVVREQNLERQRALVEEAERLASSTDWLKTVQRVTEMQAEWKQVGQVPRKQQRELWDRFRTACNTFFTRRKADLAERKQQWSNNLRIKEELCQRVEALAETEDVQSAVAAVKSAQAEWKGVGPVRRNRAEALWTRFRAACEAVFERAEVGQREVAAERAVVREALCVEVEGLLPEGASLEADLGEKVRDLQQRWREAPDVPPPLGRTLSARFGRGLSRVVEARPKEFRGTDLDPARQLKRVAKLCERVEALLPADAATSAASPVEILATKWRDALASNLMGARVDEAAQRRAAVDEVRRAKHDLRRLGHVGGDEGRRLTERFHTACDRVIQWADPAKPKRSKPAKSTAAGADLTS